MPGETGSPPHQVPGLFFLEVHALVPLHHPEPVLRALQGHGFAVHVDLLAIPETPPV